MVVELSDKALQELSEDQRKQVISQMDLHNSITTPYTESFHLTPNLNDLEGFLINPQVWAASHTTSRFLACYLRMNNGRLYDGKHVIDMGAGTGIQGVVMGLRGAEHVTFVDFSPRAIENIRANVQKFELGKKAQVIHSDLFDSVPKRKYD